MRRYTYSLHLNSFTVIGGLTFTHFSPKRFIHVYALRFLSERELSELSDHIVWNQPPGEPNPEPRAVDLRLWRKHFYSILFRTDPSWLYSRCLHPPFFELAFQILHAIQLSPNYSFLLRVEQHPRHRLVSIQFSVEYKGYEAIFVEIHLFGTYGYITRREEDRKLRETEQRRDPPFKAMFSVVLKLSCKI